MDNNVLETKSSLQNTETIPSNWNFPEKGERFRIIQKESDFLSLETDDVLRKKVDYVFNRDGTVKANRRMVDDDVHFLIHLQGEITINCSGNSYGALIFTFRVNKDKEDISDLGRLHYAKGVINSIKLPQIFRTPKENEVFAMHSPAVALHKKNKVSGLNTEDWEVTWLSEGKQFIKLPKKQSNQLIFADSSGELAHRMNWKVQGGEIVFTQEHVKAGELKILTVQMQIDTQAVNQAVFSSPPYEREISRIGSFLKVPWLTIPQIVGASLGYTKV